MKGIRLFSSIVARVPDKLVKNLELNFGGTGTENYQQLMDQKMNLDSSGRVGEFLNHEIKRGCDESRRFAQALTTVKQQDSYTGLYLQNVSTNIRAAQYFSDAIAGLINPQATLNNHSLVAGDGVDILSHSDGSSRGSDFKLDLLMLTGIESKGKARTYKMDLEKIWQRLPEQTQKILAQPMFGYVHQSDTEGFHLSREMAESLKSKVLYKDENDVLRVNFRYDRKCELLFNPRATQFSKDAVKDAINQVHEVVQDIYAKDEVESFFIKRNEMLLLKNHQALHGRDLSNQDRQRAILGSSYILPNTEVENAKNCEFRIVELGDKAR